MAACEVSPDDGQLVKLDVQLTRFLANSGIECSPDALRKPSRAESEVMAATTVDGRGIVIKRAAGDRNPKRIQRELLSYQAFGESPIADLVPEVLCTDPKGDLTGTPMLVLRQVPGRPILEALASHEMPEVHRRLGVMLRTMHSIRIPSGFGSFGNQDRRATADRYFANRVERIVGAATTLGCPAEFLKYAKDQGKRVLDEMSGSQIGAPSLCHGDLHESNYHVAYGSDGWDIAGLFDLEHAGALDPLYDLGRSSVFAHIHIGAEARLALLEGYGELGNRKGALRFYEFLHGIDLWVANERTGQFVETPLFTFLDELVRE